MWETGVRGGGETSSIFIYVSILHSQRSATGVIRAFSCLTKHFDEKARVRGLEKSSEVDVQLTRQQQQQQQ